MMVAGSAGLVKDSPGSGILVRPVFFIQTTDNHAIRRRYVNETIVPDINADMGYFSSHRPKEYEVTIHELKILNLLSGLELVRCRSGNLDIVESLENSLSEMRAVEALFVSGLASVGFAQIFLKNAPQPQVIISIVPDFVLGSSLRLLLSTSAVSRIGRTPDNKNYSEQNESSHQIKLG